MPAVAQGLPGLLGCTGLGASATQMEPGAQHQAKADGFPTAEVLSNKLGNKCCSKRVPTPHNELFQSPQNLCPRSSLFLFIFLYAVVRNSFLAKKVAGTFARVCNSCNHENLETGKYRAGEKKVQEKGEWRESPEFGILF